MGHGKFLPILMLAIFFLLRAVRQGVIPLPKRVVPFAAWGLGLASGVAHAVVAGDTWEGAIESVLLGLVGGGGAVGFHEATKARPKWAPPRVPPLSVLVLLVAALGGCASVRDASVVSLNAASDMAMHAEPIMADLDRAEQEQALKLPPAERDAKIVEIRARYRKAWDAYRSFRAAWLVAAAAVRAHDAAVAAGHEPDVGAVQRGASTLATAAQAFAVAASQIRGGGK